MYAQVVNSLILKIKNIVIFSTTFVALSLKTVNVSASLVLYMKQSHLTEIGTGKFCDLTGKKARKTRISELGLGGVLVPIFLPGKTQAK